MLKKPRIIKTIFALIVVGLVALLALFMIMHSQQETADLNAARANAPGKFIQLSQGKVHYLLQGTDTSKTVVFITGGGITGMEVWSKNIPYFLDKGYRVLAYDLYGRGYSERPAAANTPELLLGQLTELLDSLHIRERHDIVAMSLGAIVTLDYVTKYLTRVKKIVLIDPSAMGEYRISNLLRIPVVSPFMMTVYWYPRAIENQRKEFVNQPMFETYAQRLKYFMVFKGYKKMTHDTWMYVLNQNKSSLLANVPPHRMLVLYGTHDPYFPPGNIPLFEKIYPTLKSVPIEAAGHMPHYEKPEEVNPMMEEFLAR